MPRQPLPVGTAGTISTSARIDGRWIPAKDVDADARPDRWRARALYRDPDGHTRPIERHGLTENKARTALATAIRDRSGTGAHTLTAGSRFRDVAQVYLEHIRERRSATTYNRYASRLKIYVLPALGELRLREVTAGRIQRYLDELERRHVAANTRRGIRTVISGVLQYAAARVEIISSNPAIGLERIEGGPRRKTHAFTAAELADFLTKLDADSASRSADLPDLIRFLFGTGARIGEALALRWRDVNLTDENVRVTDPATGDVEDVPPGGIWINGNIVDDNGTIRRHEGKTFTSRGVLLLPDYLRVLLLVRKPLTAGEDEPVFPSLVLGWRHPSNVQRSIRRMRARIGYPEFRTHVGRRTVATILDERGHTAREIADQLRHARPSMTQDIYMERGRVNERAAGALDSIHKPA